VHGGKRPGEPPESSTFNVVLQEAAITGVLSPNLLADPNHAIEAAHRIAVRLNSLTSGHECPWQGKVVAGEGLVFSRTHHGVHERYLIDATVLLSIEARRLDAAGEELRDASRRLIMALDPPI
jgi:DNA gyrase subunit B